MNEEQKYYLGLDIGTDSVGWCVTDYDYHVVRKQGKHLWGARLFEAASPAADRRTNREARRRYQRRRWRINLLQSLFAEEMNKHDANFFDRLNNSAYHKEDKPANCQTPNLLFNGSKTDSVYFKDYPTIYHLRYEMMNNPEKQYDLKQVYLALAHMIKYRGNFLYEGEMKSIGSDPTTLTNLFNDIDELMREDNQEGEDAPDSIATFNCNDDKSQKLITAFITKFKKQELCDSEAEAFGFKVGKDLPSGLLKLVNGSKMSVSALFRDINDSEVSNLSLDFTSDDFEKSVAPSLSSQIGDVRTNIIMLAKQIYDYRILISLLKGKATISEAMIDTYQTHKDQLKVLKRLYKDYAPEKYNNFFRKTIKVEIDPKNKKPKNVAITNYVNYVGYNKIGKKKECLKHSVSNEDLCKVIKKDLPFDKTDDFAWKRPDDRKLLSDIFNQMESGVYLRIQNSKLNGVFPYQLNEMEMKKIIDNQKKYYPFLGECSKEKPNEYKIVTLLKFKVPYYVGPLSPKATIGWSVRKQEDVKITPWNFDDVIDKEKTEERFIDRMKNSCTYIFGEQTLPKSSLLYSEFILLNEMNNWLINGEKITEEDKKYLIDNLYLKQKKVSVTKLKSVLKSKYKNENVLLSQRTKELKEEDLHASLASFIDMANDRGFGEKFYLDEKKRELAEEVIFTLTMFEDGNVASERMRKLGLSESQIKYFSSLHYSGWGKMSQKLLDGLTSEVLDNTTGEYINKTIMDLMRVSPLNFMEIYETKNSFDFKEQVDRLNKTKNLTIDEIIEDEYVSPDMKRALKQTKRIVEELKKILHIDSFSSYFVECTRSEQEKKRTLSRKKQLTDIFKAAKTLAREEVKERLASIPEEKLRAKKYFYYFMQLGYDVYSGEPISFEDLQSGSNYDIDHIIPQAKLKDDSFNNTVLVSKSANNSKSDTYPIPKTILLDKGREIIIKLNSIHDSNKKSYLMPKDKMDRLLRITPLTDSELTGFVNKQLTITDQAVKATCDVLKMVDPKANIVYSKANVVSEFRNSFGLTKCRDINDFHHANDAYLNIVVGNVYNKTFSANFNEKLYQEHHDAFESMKIDPKHFFTQSKFIMGTNVCIWRAPYVKDGAEDPNDKSTLKTIQKYMAMNDPMVTQMLKTQSGFFNKTSIHSVADGGNCFPLKANGIFNKPGWEKNYGGYSDMTSPYYMLVKSDGKNGKSSYSLETIPSIIAAGMGDDNQKKLNYLTTTLKLKNPEIILKKLLIRTVIELPVTTSKGKVGKARMGISGKSGNYLICVNLSELHLPKEYQDYSKKISIVLGTTLPAGRKKDLSKVDQKTNEPLFDNRTKVTKEENQKLFDYYCDVVLNKPCFIGLPATSSYITKILDNHDKFASLSTFDQITVLSSITYLLACKINAAKCNFSSLGMALHCGPIYLPKQLPAGASIIAQSPTGFYEKVLFTVPKE